jgi:hypothetical protein
MDTESRRLNADGLHYANLMNELKARLKVVKLMAPQLVYGTTSVLEERLHAEAVCLQLSARSLS